MNIKWLTAIIFSFTFFSASSQTLFTYGGYHADAKDFLRAFNKNNQQTASGKSKAIKEYLDLYIHSRLKIREAYDRGYDTLPSIKNEVINLRSQIIENYINDPKTLNRLTKEAFQRSLKDIHAAHIFISFKNASGNMDTLAARKKLDNVLKRLEKKEDFSIVAQKYSDDPSAVTNKGDLNFITVFTLPYEFENIIYSTAPGKYSKPYTSTAGFHIFKNLGERKALGKIKVQQILLAFAPGINDTDKKIIDQLADSLYKRIKAGDDFSKLAAAYSNDYISAGSEGNIPDVSVGQYDPVFENMAWSLKNGDVSKPFVTSHGFHIVKRISSRPVVTNAADKSNTEELQQKVRATDRWNTAREIIYPLVKSKAGFEKYPYKELVLWSLSDSLLDRKAAGIGSAMNTQSPLFKIGDTVLRVADWITYSQMNRYSADRSSIKPYPDLMNEFTRTVLYRYYRDHLEDFNDEFKNQMNEFRDGNLFFEIMQQEVWNKAQADSSALLALYEKNKADYNWKQSADAVIFFCSDETSAKTLFNQLKKNPSEWKMAAESLTEKVVADSARYEWQQIPGLGKTIPYTGFITPVSVNKVDNTASFALIKTVYPKPESRSFNEAKGLVMNDYQTLLEEEWITDLKKKYPVIIDQKVLANISK